MNVKNLFLVLSILIFQLPFMMKADNVFLNDFKTTHGLIPFDYFSNGDFEPAILEGIDEQNREIASIVRQRSTPTFENTIVALERSGKTLNRTLYVFYAMLSSNADDELMEISQKMSPVLSEHSANITLNQPLWEKVKYVYDNRAKLQLSREDEMLLAETYDSFVNSGANLQGDDREKYRQLTSELDSLTLAFGQNALKAMNSQELWLTENDLDGLPQTLIDAAKLAAEEKGRADAYLFTVQAPSYRPFLQYSARRDLREKIYRMYNTLCTDGEYSNIENIKQIALKRMQLANLMGYKTYADYKLRRTMAGSTDAVYTLLGQLRKAYTPVMNEELKSLTQFASEIEGKEIKLQPWDYSYYSNKQKDSLYNFNDEMLRPYFELNNVIKGVFGLATRLYGLHFNQNYDAQVLTPDVKVYGVTDEQGNYMGALYADFFPRSTKRSGAWMTNYREQCIDADGNNIRPIVSITMNFTKPTADKPSLLTFDEVETFLHEFGHALQGLLANTRYSSLSGTNVYRDYVELPSQFNENFLLHREFLDTFAKHYETGETIPQELIDRVVAASQYAAGYLCVRQLNFGYLDMAYHTITEPINDVFAFEADAIKDVKQFDAAPGCLISPVFSHIFSGGYAAGYYSYKWSEVLDADAFSKFEEDGIFNPQTAKSFKDNILSTGGTEDPKILYKRFRGRDAKIDALLKRDGISK